MTSVLTIVCTNCKHEFHGHLNELPMVKIEYFATCPECKEEVSFSNKAGWIDGNIPEGAVKVHQRQCVTSRRVSLYHSFL